MPYDSDLLFAIKQTSIPAVRLAFEWITRIGSLHFWLVLAFYLWIRKSYRVSATLLAGLIIDMMVVAVFKTAVNRPRPYESPLAFETPFIETDSSLPSGHTSRSFVAAVVLRKFYPGYGLLLFGAASVIGFSRIYIGVHYPLDVLLGALNGTAIGLVVKNIRFRKVEAAMERLFKVLANVLKRSEKV